MGNIRLAVEGVSAAFREEMTKRLRLDSWWNAVNGLGGSRDRTVQASVLRVVPLPLETLEHLYHGNDLAAKIVDLPVEDALRQGFEIEGDERYAEALRKYGVKKALQDAATWGRLYGAGAVYLVTDDPRQDLPYSGGLKSLRVLDRFTLMREPQDPTLYRVDGTLVVHASRIVLFGGARTSDHMKLANGGFDLSVLQRPFDTLRDLGEAWRSSMNLIQDMSQAVFSIKGLMDMIANGQKNVLLERMELVDLSRSVARSIVIDADGEEFRHEGASNVSGVPEIIQMISTRLSAACGIPVTRLFGTSPGGLNATGESDTRHYYDGVQAYRTDELDPAILAIARAVGGAENLPTEDLSVTWPSLWQTTEKERVDIDKVRADTAIAYVNAGVLHPDEVAAVEFAEGPYAEALAENEAAESAATDTEEKDPTSALNGAQVTALAGIVTAVAQGQLPRDSGVQLMLAAFPLTPQQAEKIMGSVGKTFVPDAPPPTSP